MQTARSFSSFVGGLLIIAMGAGGAMTAFSGQTAVRRLPPGGESKQLAAEFEAPVTGAVHQAARQPASATNRIRLSVDGLLTGRFQVADPQMGELVRTSQLDILFLQNGRLITQVTPGEGGVFQASGLRPGIYSMIVLGDVGFLAYAVEVLPPDDRSRDGSEGQLHAALVSPRDFPAVRRLIREYVPAAPTVPSDADAATAPPIPRPEDEAAAEFARRPRSIHTLELQADGTASGQLVRRDGSAAPGGTMGTMNVFLIHGGQIVAESPVAPGGAFQFREVRPGLHSFVAAGPEGFAAMGLHVVAPPAHANRDQTESIRSASTRSTRHVFVAQDESTGIVLEVPVIDPADLGPVRAFAGGGDGGPLVGQPGPMPVPPPPVAVPAAGGPGFAGGGFGGPFGGGGGGFGAEAGLLGALAGIGAGLGIGAAVFDDDDFRPIIPPVASPFQP